MRPVQRSEIVDYLTYEDGRAQRRAQILAIKAARRIVVGEWFVFLFENRDTVRYQVQEMVRAEKIVREADIQHELDTYNELLHGDGKLGCALLISIDDREERQVKLERWLGLVDTIYATLPSGERVHPSYDPAQVGDTALSAVQYLTFDLQGVAPTAIGVDHEDIRVEAELTAEQRDALQADLDG